MRSTNICTTTTNIERYHCNCNKNIVSNHELWIAVNQPSVFDRHQSTNNNRVRRKIQT